MFMHTLFEGAGSEKMHVLYICENVDIFVLPLNGDAFMLFIDNGTCYSPIAFV